MADQVPANPAPATLETLLRDLVNAVIMQQGQIAELQGDRTTLQAEVAALQGHAEMIAGDTGITVQLGDLSAVPALHDQLVAAMPAPAEPAVPQASLEPQQAAA